MRSRRNRKIAAFATTLLSSAVVISALAPAAVARPTQSSSDSGRGTFHFPASAAHFDRDDARPPHRPHGGPAAPVVVTSGLNNPRQLSLVDQGTLLIAEAGKGGSACSGTGPDAMCIGATGSVSGVFLPQAGTDRRHIELVTGLISGSGPDGSFAVGSDGVSQRHLGSPIYVQETFAPPDVIPSGLPGEQSGKLLRARPFGAAHPVADITAFELANDPDGHGFDSNPYAVVARAHDELVADAAGNAVLRVDHRGNVSVFHVFPNIVNTVTTTPSNGFPGFDPTPEFPGANFVPTSIAIGPHGDVFVGGLASELPGQAQVVELNGRTGHVVRTFTGFSTITGLAIGRDGSMYVSQLEAPESNPPTPEVVGVLTKVSPNGKHHDVDVPFPAGVAVDKWDNVFVSAFSVAPASGLAGAPAGFDSSGQVWRLHF
jgi:hypothetical protein